MEAFNRTLVLWMSGLTWEIADKIPAISALRSEGAIVTALEPRPITGQQMQARQMLSGQNPAHTGYFDVWLPRQYSAQPVTLPGVGESLLCEVIAGAGHTVTWMELALVDVASYLNEATTSADCLIIQTVIGNDPALESIEEAVDAARSWAGADGTLLFLSEYQEAAIKNYVNLNDALQALGVLEISAQKTIDWGETLAYHVGYGQLWINLRGREPDGIVASGDEYNQTCQALAHALPGKLLDPQTGEPVIERVYRRDDLYQGDYLFQAPDLVAVLRSGYAPSPASVACGLDGEVVWPAPAGTRAVAGCNPATVAGLAIAVGAPFATGRVVGNSALAGIAPTVLHALRLPIPTSMEAEVITDLFTPAFMQQFPVQRVDFISNLSSEDEEEVIARLKSLGYL